MSKNTTVGTSTKYLIDTNIISELMRKTPNAQVLLWFESQPSPTISALSVDEICYGLKRQPSASKSALFAALLEHCTVTPIDAAIAKRAGEIRADLALQGQIRSEYDMLIAASGYVFGHVIVTRNVRDFLDTGVSVFNPFD